MPADMERDAVLMLVAVGVPTVAVITALVVWGFRGRKREYLRGFEAGYIGGKDEGFRAGWNRFAVIFNQEHRSKH